MQLELKFSSKLANSHCVCVCVFFIVCAEFCSNLLHISCSCAKFMMALISLQTARETEEKWQKLLTDL